MSRGSDVGCAVMWGIFFLVTVVLVIVWLIGGKSLWQAKPELLIELQAYIFLVPCVIFGLLAAADTAAFVTWRELPGVVGYWLLLLVPCYIVLVSVYVGYLMALGLACLLLGLGKDIPDVRNWEAPYAPGCWIAICTASLCGSAILVHLLSLLTSLPRSLLKVSLRELKRLGGFFRR